MAWAVATRWLTFLGAALAAAGFASTNDLAKETISFDEPGPGLYAYTAERDLETWRALEGASPVKSTEANP